MRNAVVARRYARALYELSRDEGLLAEVAAELDGFAGAFGAHEDLRRILLHPAIPLKGKEGLLGKLVAKEITRDFLKFLLGKGRLALLPAVHEEFLREYRGGEGVVVAEVTSAAPLTKKTQTRLVGVLERLTGNRVELRARVDEEVIGGLRLRLGDHVIDATLANRLEGVRDAMAGEMRP